MYNGKHGGDGEAIVLSFPVILRRQGRDVSHVQVQNARTTRTHTQTIGWNTCSIF